MGTRKTTTLEVDGHAIEVAVTELIPGRWSWAVKIDGQYLCSGTAPEVTFHAAYFAALSGLKKQYPYRSNGLDPESLPSPGLAFRNDQHPH